MYRLCQNLLVTKPRTTVNILWTGGWDSTFRITQLSERNIVIQPYYLLCGRNSETYELNAISTITKLIRDRPSTACTLLDVITVAVDESDSHAEISESYNALRSVRPFGIQYDWLARLANKVKGLELAIHKDDKALGVINEFGKVIKRYHEELGDYYVLDSDNSSIDAQRVFANFHFPLLEYTKVRMKREAEERGFIDLMNRTWFCYFPVNGEPCGICNPCVYSIDEGMGYRFSKVAMRKYRARKNRARLRRIAAVTGLLYIWRYLKSSKQSESE